MKKAVIFIAVSIISFLASSAGAAETYALIKIKGAINPIVSGFVVDSIGNANRAGDAFAVIQLDTPGGLIISMRDIIQSIMTSGIPVVVYTYPKGAQAASAGGFIMLSAHVAVMSPGTEIGAMHPVSPMLDYFKRDSRGDPAGVMEKKVLNDTVAYARSIAQKRGRNVKWAENAVRNAVSNSYAEAFRAGVIDFVAEDMNDMLRLLNGRKINLNGSDYVFSTAGLSGRVIEMDWKQRILNNFADPQIMLLLLVIAVLGIGMEFKNPGMIFPGTAGAVSLFMFLLAARIIPVNLAGFVLIIIAVALFILELKFTSYGMLTIGGAAAFIAGSLLLFDSPLPGGGLPVATILAVLLVVLAFVFIVVKSVLNVHRTRVTTGSEGMVGEKGRARGGFNGRGLAMVHGEIWSAVSEGEITDGQEIIVTEVRGMELHVKPSGGQ